MQTKDFLRCVKSHGISYLFLSFLSMYISNSICYLLELFFYDPLYTFLINLAYPRIFLVLLMILLNAISCSRRTYVEP